MSSQEDNTDNRKLKEFLNKNKISENRSMDDFEKEALEGFAMLDNEKEAFELKSNLDAKIYKEVFAEEKKSGNVIWYAAAGLALLIGFSVYFIQNNPVSKNEDLAVHSQIPNVDEIQKDLESQNKKSENLQFKKTENSIETRTSTPKNSETEREAYKQIGPNKTEKTISKQNSDAESTSAEAVVSETKPQAAPVLAPMEDKHEMMQPTTGSGAASLGTNKNLAQDDLDKSSFSITKSDEKISIAEVQKAKASSSKKRSKNEEQTVAANSKHTAAEPYGSSCFYSGGEETLVKDLKNLLSPKNLSQKFDASLFINENKKVEKVVFTNVYDLSKKQQKEIIEILKQLDKFNVTGATTKTLVEYKLVYRP